MKILLLLRKKTLNSHLCLDRKGKKQDSLIQECIPTETLKLHWHGTDNVQTKKCPLDTPEMGLPHSQLGQ